MSFVPQMKEQFMQLAEIEFGPVYEADITVRPAEKGGVDLLYRHDGAGGYSGATSGHARLTKLCSAAQAGGLACKASSVNMRVTLPDAQESVDALRSAKEHAVNVWLTEMAQTAAKDMNELMARAGTDKAHNAQRIHNALTGALPKVVREDGQLAALARRRLLEEAREQGGAVK